MISETNDEYTKLYELAKPSQANEGGTLFDVITFRHGNSFEASSGGHLSRKFLSRTFPVDTILTSEFRAQSKSGGKFCSRHTNTEFIALKHIFLLAFRPRHLIFQAHSINFFHRLINCFWICRGYAKVLCFLLALLSSAILIFLKFFGVLQWNFQGIVLFLIRSTTNDNESSSEIFSSIVLKLIIVAFYILELHMLG